MHLTISLAQMTIALGNPEANLARAQDMIAEAATAGAHIVVFPELWTTGYDLLNAARYATRLNQGICSHLAKLASQHKIAVLGSSLTVIETGHTGNTATLFTADGKLIGIYSKVHLFPLMDEPLFLTAGKYPGLAETSWGRVGLAICYDIRFPELFRLYAVHGALLTFVMAEWPTVRIDHWQALLRARAIENHMYIVACNATGTTGDTAFCGHSCIIDPWGNVVVEADMSDKLVTATIDTNTVYEAREKMPVLTDRAPEVYAMSYDPHNPFLSSLMRKVSPLVSELSIAEKTLEQARTQGNLAAISAANKQIQEIRERIAKARNELHTLAGERIHLLEFAEQASRHCRQAERNLEDHDHRMDQLRQEIERLGGSTLSLPGHPRSHL